MDFGFGKNRLQIFLNYFIFHNWPQLNMFGYYGEQMFNDYDGAPTRHGYRCFKEISDAARRRGLFFSSLFTNIMNAHREPFSLSVSH